MSVRLCSDTVLRRPKKVYLLRSQREVNISQRTPCVQTRRVQLKTVYLWYYRSHTLLNPESKLPLIGTKRALCDQNRKSRNNRPAIKCAYLRGDKSCTMYGTCTCTVQCIVKRCGCSCTCRPTHVHCTCTWQSPHGKNLQEQTPRKFGK